MSLITEVKERLRALLRGAHEDRELEEELRFHLEMEVEENLRRGMRPEEAWRQANLRLGGVAQVREAARDARAACAGWRTSSPICGTARACCGGARGSRSSRW